MIDQKRAKNNPVFSLLNYASLAAAVHYILYSFFECTTFKFPYNDVFFSITFSLVVVLGTLKLLTGIWQKSQQSDDKKAKQILLIKELVALATIIPCVIVTEKFGYVFFVYMPFVAFCFYGNDIKLVLKGLTFCIAMVLAATILCALSGSILNLLYARAEDGNRIRGSYGICYPTDCAAYLIYLFLFIWISKQGKNWWSTILFTVLSLLLAYGIYIYTDSKTGIICAGLIALAILYNRLNEAVLSQNKRTARITKVVDAITVWAFPICGITMIGLTLLYGGGNSFAIKANQWLSTRLELTWTAIQTYGINAFGAQTPQRGLGGAVIYGQGWNYEFLDSSYALMLIRYGWVLLLLVGFIWIWMTRKAIKTGHRTIALAMAIIAFHSFSEHHMLDYSFNLLLAMPLCDFSSSQERSTEQSTEKKEAAGWIAGSIVALALVLLLPRLLSWVRSLVTMKNWTGTAYMNKGIWSQFALYAWLLFLGGVVAVWFALRQLLKEILEKKKICWKAPAALAVLIVLAFTGAALVNGYITRKGLKYDKQLSAETEAIEAILESAKEPVYAGQMEEIYKRRFPEIKDWVLSAEEHARTRQGSIILENGNEGFLLLSTGALYTEISSQTGLFTYDRAVIDSLTSAGYSFSDYYTSERKVDLLEIAQMNEMEPTENGGLLLHGEEKPLRYGPYLDQHAGDYVVTYKLHMLSKGNEGDVCLLRVTSMFGGVTRAKKEIAAGSFDDDGYLTISLHYTVEDTRGVEFKVFPYDQIDMVVEEITWKRET